MIFGYRFAKKSVVLVLIAALIVAAIAVVAVTGADGSRSAAAEDAFVMRDEVVFAHLTDTHYFPAAYCGDITAVGTDYYDFMATSMKMVVEAAPYNIAAMDQILSELPDYLFVTGDLTLNGEIQGHIEMSNLLRGLQNAVREAGKPGFQIFVVFGNHDMYNDEAFSYRTNTETFVENVTRADIVKIYSSLGYPDLTNEEIAAYYDSLAADGFEVYSDHAPYDESAVSGEAQNGMKYINSTTAEGIEAKWLFRENGQEARMESGEITDYDYGDISAIFTLPEEYSVILVDEELSNTEQQHHLGGMLFEQVKDWLSAEKEAGTFGTDTIIALEHHNALPHFTGEDTLLKDFTMYNSEETADYMADLGVRYIFSGHMHSNDITSRVSLNGNLLTDTETSSVTGYRGAVRYARISRGVVGDKAAENFETRLEMLDSVDFTYLFENGLLTDDYIERFGLGEYIGSDRIVTDPSMYAATKLFLNIIDNVVYGSFINVDFLGNLGSLVEGLLPESADGVLGSLLNAIRPVAGQLVNNLVDHIEDVVLADYVYGGDRTEFTSDVRGAKLGGYLDELIQAAAYMPLNSAGDTLFDFVIGAYLDHVGGTDRPYSETTEDQREALDGLRDGSSIEKLLGILLEEETGLYRVVMGLFAPIDLTTGVPDSTVNALESVLGLLLGEVDLSALDLNSNALLNRVFDMLSAFGLDLGLDLKGMSGAEFIDDVLNSYVTDAFYASLGEIAHGIVYAFMIDEDAHTENSVGEYALYKWDETLAASWVSGEVDNTPTAERGMLPTQLTVTFGDEPKTTKNFVWFTDDAITGTQIQYIEGTEFDESAAVTVTGTFAKYATTTANIDLGIFATLMQTEVGRHSVSLTGLEPGTTYSYRVGSEELGYWSDVYTFTTAPEEGTPFEALLMTDIQGSGMKPYSIASDIMEAIASGDIFSGGFDFIINAGDVVDNDRNWVQWEYYLGSMQDYWANTTTVVANGNHDEHYYEGIDTEDIAEVAEYMWLDDSIQDPYNYLLLHFGISYPAQDDSTGAYYSFDYSDVHFTVLNTNNLDANTHALSRAQLEWLNEDLDSTDRKFKVVIMHKSIYSAGSHIDDTDVIALREQLTPLFAEKGVALVLSGHDHTYSESYYIDANGNAMEVDADATTELGTVNGGVLYVSLGTFGDKFYNFRTSEDIPLEFGEALHEPTLSDPTFGKLVYDGERLWYTGYQYDVETGEIADVHSLVAGDLERIIVIAAVCVAGVLTIMAVLIAIRRAASKKK